MHHSAMKKFLCFGLLLLSQSALFAQYSKRPLQPGDIYRMQTIGEPEVSPDGGWVAYTVTSVDSAKDKRNSDIWMTSWDGKEKLQLTNNPEGESNAQWSPDGKYLSFMASRNGTTQVWLLNRKGGEAIKLTDVKGELQDYAWSPDAKRMVLSIKEPLDTGKGKIPKPYIINKYRFKQDVSGYLYDTRRTHLFLFDIAAKKLDTLTSGLHNESGAEWSPDGRHIAFVSNRTEDPDKNNNTDIFIIEAKAGAVAKPLTTWAGSDNNPQWSPDGKSIAYLRSTSDQNYIMYDQQVLCIIPATGGEPKTLSHFLDRPVGSPHWSKNSDSIAVLVTDDCKRYVASFAANDGKMKKLTDGDLSYTSLRMHPGGGWLVSMSTPYLPSELYAVEEGKQRRLTTIHNIFVDSLQFASVQKITSKSKDGTSVSSLLFLPHGTEGKKLPLIVWIHGGPVAQDDFGFDLTRQMLAAKGYAVLAVNYRGSNGRGIAYSKAIYADWGNKEVIDILGAVDNVVAKGLVDKDRMGIGGWSYGGILTNYTIAKDTRFKAASSGAGSALQLSLYGVDQYILQLDNELGQPWKNNNYQKYLKLSYPFLHADKIKTPTQFVTGEKDFNVPAIGSEQMYQALRSQDIPTELLVYPGQHHGFTQPSFIKDRFERYYLWFGKYLNVKNL